MDKYKLVIKKFNELTNQELYDILKLRIDVFTIEQKILVNDLDDLDLESTFYFLKDNNIIISVIRLIDYSSFYKIGRIIVKKEYRNQKIASKLIIKIINDLEKYKKDIIVSGQYHLLKFYESLGFIKEGDPYIEDTILHQKLIYKYNKKSH